MKITGLSHITLGVEDLKRSRQFYSTLFSVRPKHGAEYKDCHFVFGDMWFVLVQDCGSRPAKGYSHIAFTVSAREFEELSKTIKSLGTRIWQENSTFGDSLYFEDPDGHKLEIHSGTPEERFQFGESLQKKESQNR